MYCNTCSTIAYKTLVNDAKTLLPTGSTPMAYYVLTGEDGACALSISPQCVSPRCTASPGKSESVCVVRCTGVRRVACTTTGGSQSVCDHRLAHIHDQLDYSHYFVFVLLADFAKLAMLLNSAIVDCRVSLLLSSQSLSPPTPTLNG